MKGKHGLNQKATVRGAPWPQYTYFVSLLCSDQECNPHTRNRIATICNNHAILFGCGVHEDASVSKQREKCTAGCGAGQEFVTKSAGQDCSAAAVLSHSSDFVMPRERTCSPKRACRSLIACCNFSSFCQSRSHKPIC